ncbi:MAG: neutral/alkaline non-lysosomal ceramidase N-terminal domain-containing protein [Thermoguttaceae bacterium]
MTTAVILAMAVLGGVANANDFQAGVARKAITPTGSIWMSGYAARHTPSEGVMHDLWAKALAMKDGRGHRVVIVTIDVIGLPREVTDEVVARLTKKHGLERKDIMLNAAHVHSGPIIWPNLRLLYDFSDKDKRQLIDYRAKLIDDLVEVAGEAMADLKPATLAVGHGSASFGTNRRAWAKKKWAPVDHDAPVVRIAAPDGRIRVVLFGYACHNTAFVETCHKLSGDYAGFAQIELEKAVPGATAMFLMLCGADQNPMPRGTEDLARQHGKAICQAVQETLAGPMESPEPAIRTAYDEATLDIARVDRAAFHRELKSDNVFRRRRAAAILADLDAGKNVWQQAVPVQAIRLGGRVVLLGIGGEPVVDYPLRLKREFPKLNLIVAGYTNDVMCYIPSHRILMEGGYEAVDNMVYYGKPGPFAGTVEDRVIAACHRTLGEVGEK